MISIHGVYSSKDMIELRKDIEIRIHQILQELYEYRS